MVNGHAPEILFTVY